MSGKFLPPSLPSSPLALSSSLPACHDTPATATSLSLPFSLSVYLYPSLSLSSLPVCRLSCLLTSVSRVSCVSRLSPLYLPVCRAYLPPISQPVAACSSLPGLPVSSLPLVSYTALSVVCGSHASISIALRASCLAYRASVSSLSCFLCLPVSRLSYLPSHALSWAHPRLHPACLVMPDDLSLHPNLPPRALLSGPVSPPCPRAV